MVPGALVRSNAADHICGLVMSLELGQQRAVIVSEDCDPDQLPGLGPPDECDIAFVTSARHARRAGPAQRGAVSMGVTRKGLHPVRDRLG